jgi:hypothetical protein
LFQAMQPHLEESVYVNNLGDEGQGWGPRGLRGELPAAGAVKRTYDPDSLFRANHNIVPATDAASGPDNR